MSQLQLPLFDSLAKENERLRNENIELRQEVKRLREIIQQIKRGTSAEAVLPPASQSKAAIQHNGKTADDLISQERIQLFRSLFRGRDDVYASRWESNGKSNYSPARKHDWDSHVLDKSTGKRVCPKTCQTLPFTDAVVAGHLQSSTVIGVYPMLPDETCWFLAVDFDKTSWQDDAAAFLRACSAFDVPAYLERSRSGNGATYGSFSIELWRPLKHEGLGQRS